MVEGVKGPWGLTTPAHEPSLVKVPPDKEKVVRNEWGEVDLGTQNQNSLQN